MKRIIIAALAAVCLAACATTTTTAADGTTTTQVDATKGQVAVAAHEDLLAAAAYAQAHGYPARAAVWLAEDARLTAIETQISACANSIAASLPKPGTGPAPVGPFTAVEIAAETVASFNGPSAAVKANCEPFPIVTVPALPKLP